MAKTLVIVESPGKIKKILSYLGQNYIVKASCGHLQELDKKTLSVDIENNFKPLYVNIADKNNIIKMLKQEYNKSENIIIATDGDREGEAIAYSIQQLLKLNSPQRIIFNEITKVAIQNALNNVSQININLVHAQQTRRILDRLVGYLISPLMWKHLNIQGIQSAGRVQSATLNLIIDKETEIKNTIPQSTYKMDGYFLNTNKEILPVSHFKLLKPSNTIFENDNTIISFLKTINELIVFKIISTDKKTEYRNSPQPFITSTLQQKRVKN